MSGLLLPMLLFAVALAATFLTYRNIRRGGARFYTLEREIILRRAAFTLIVAPGVFTGTLPFLLLQPHDLIQSSLPPGEAGARETGGRPVGPHLRHTTPPT